MVGIIIIAHGGLSDELIRTMGMIVEGDTSAITSVALSGLEEPEEIRQLITQAIDKVDDGDGVVIFTDMFGGRPSNIALSFLSEDRVEIISGVNLPMLIDMIYARKGKTLSDIASQLAETGRSSIRLVSQYLRGES